MPLRFQRERRPPLCHPEARKTEGVILGAWKTLSRGATFALRAQKARRWIAFSATRWQRNRGSAAHLFPSVRAGRAVSEKPIHPRILIFNLLHKTSLAAERGSMGAVEGPPISRGFSCGAAAVSVTYQRSAQEPTEVGGPSTPPMLPRSAQDDKEWRTALSLLARLCPAPRCISSLQRVIRSLKNICCGTATSVVISLQK